MWYDLRQLQICFCILYLDLSDLYDVDRVEPTARFWEVFRGRMMFRPSERVDEEDPRLTDCERFPLFMLSRPETVPWLLRSDTLVVRLAEAGLALTDLSIRTVSRLLLPSERSRTLELTEAEDALTFAMLLTFWAERLFPASTVSGRL